MIALKNRCDQYLSTKLWVETAPDLLIFITVYLCLLFIQNKTLVPFIT